MINAIKEGKDLLDRTFPLENAAVLNAVGMINVADSIAAIKKLIFDEKKISMEELKVALETNWAGDKNEQIRQLCIAAPKYGNDDDYVDNIVKDLYQFWAENTIKFKNIYGGTMKPTGISISAQWPGGALTGATPDGRYSGECLADGTMSPMHGRDIHGPTAIIKSALKVDQVPYQATLLNMKFHPSAVQNIEDVEKLSSLIRTYFSLGGKHIQFNVVSRDTMFEAQKHPENYRDLIVRVAGYSAYFVQLGKVVQDEIINRKEYDTTN
jgi:pyruvate-formate lyase